MIDFIGFKIKNKVIYLTKETTGFSNVYLKVREKENRVLSDEDVLKLPHINKFEWPQRLQSTKRFITYIKNKKKPLSILEIGCGNGWFSNKLANVSNKNTVVGLDINKTELEQATRLFTANNLTFVYANVFECTPFFLEKFDIISINGSIQYFEDFEGLINQLKSYLKPLGEIHIIDSPFYKTEDISNAKSRTLNYFTVLGVPEMVNYYFHFNKSCLKDFTELYCYNKYALSKFLGKKDSPFSWYRFIKK